MTEERRHVCLGFTDERYPEGTHICYLYSDDEERRRIGDAARARVLRDHTAAHRARELEGYVA